MKENFSLVEQSHLLPQLVSLHPSSPLLSLAHFTVEYVNNACSAQHVQQLPHLPQGTFEFVDKKEDTRVYQYTFRYQRGCRDVHVSLLYLTLP